MLRFTRWLIVALKDALLTYAKNVKQRPRWKCISFNCLRACWDNFFIIALDWPPWNAFIFVYINLVTYKSYKTRKTNQTKPIKMHFYSMQLLTLTSIVHRDSKPCKGKVKEKREVKLHTISHCLVFHGCALAHRDCRHHQQQVRFTCAWTWNKRRRLVFIYILWSWVGFRILEWERK